MLGGETLRPFSLALLMGILFGTYDSIAIASPIMVWWEKRLEAANRVSVTGVRKSGLQPDNRSTAGQPERVGAGARKPTRAARA
jgi:preprotein translocase subunit SecF